MTTDEMVNDLEFAYGDLVLRGADDALIDSVAGALNTRTDEGLRDAHAAVQRWLAAEQLLAERSDES